MIALPGPGLLVIPIGLAILATEFLWAQRLMKKFKETADQVSTPQKAKVFFLKNKLKVQQKVAQFFKKTVTTQPQPPLSDSQREGREG